MNAVRLSARLVERDPLRYTPAGIPVLGVRLQHDSMQAEAGSQRRVELELAAIAMAEQALRLERVELGRGIAISGFLAPRRRNSRGLVLHVTGFEIDED